MCTSAQDHSYKADSAEFSASDEHGRQREKNKFSKCEKGVTAAEIAEIERGLGFVFPEEFKQHYLCSNGGIPARPLWVDPSGQWDDIEIRDFIPLRYARNFGDDPDFTGEGRARGEWAQQKLPRPLFPFAFDWGGNYFCLNLEDGSLAYFVRDVWSDNLSVEKNLEMNTRWLAGSFHEFVAGLAPCDDD